jgi:hypothetical protein
LFLFEEGTVLGLPLMIRFPNQLLGDHCQIGSASDPLELRHHSGKSGNLKGSLTGLDPSASQMAMSSSTGKNTAVLSRTLKKRCAEAQLSLGTVPDAPPVRKHRFKVLDRRVAPVGFWPRWRQAALSGQETGTGTATAAAMPANKLDQGESSR